MRIKISEPVVIARGPETEKSKWGPYQFPNLWQMPDGRILCDFHDADDSVTAYGAEPVFCVSADRGQSWERVQRKAIDHLMGISLPNGELLRYTNPPSLPLEGMPLPEPVCTSVKGFSAYFADRIPDGICQKTWQFFRVTQADPEGKTEQAKLNWPHMFLTSAKGVLIQPHPAGRMRLAPDGTLWLPHYASVGVDPETGKVDSLQMSNYLFKSSDQGHTWELVSYLPYYPPSERESTWEGYNENDIAFAPDGSMIRLIRTHVIYAKEAAEPMLFTRSTDGGRTWSKPTEFDFTGVWPALLTLRCGVTLATYGRPGLFLRATDDPSCQVWEDPIELIHSNRRQGLLNMATCSYTDLLPLDDHTAGLVYSDFTVKDETGIPRKTILFRTITVEL